MKTRNCAALLIACTSISLLAGCSARETVRTLDAAEDMLEHRLDAAEDMVERRLDAVEDAAEVSLQPEIKPGNHTALVSETMLTAEEAQAIVLEHAGFTADQVNWLRAEFEIDDRVPQYDVQFRQGMWEYEYEIHGETGEILSMDVDD